jgi:hypothetical protein
VSPQTNIAPHFRFSVAEIACSKVLEVGQSKKLTASNVQVQMTNAVYHDQSYVQNDSLDFSVC